MAKILKISLLLLFSLFLVMGAVNSVKADNTVMGTQKTDSTGGSGNSGKKADLANPLKVDSPQKLIGQIINSLLGIVGSLALLMFIWGGFQWMTAAGNDEKVSKGKRTLVWAALGMVVIFSSYALVSYLINNVIKPSNSAVESKK